MNKHTFNPEKCKCPYCTEESRRLEVFGSACSYCDGSGVITDPELIHDLHPEGLPKICVWHIWPERVTSGIYKWSMRLKVRKTKSGLYADMVWRDFMDDVRGQYYDDMARQF